MMIARSRRNKKNFFLKKKKKKKKKKRKRAASRGRCVYQEVLGPPDRRVVTILAGVVPAHSVIIKRISGGAYRKSELFGAERAAGVCPHLAARIWCCRQRINTHVQDARNFRGACFAFDAVGNWSPFFTPRFFAISGAKCAMVPPAAPVKMAPKASVCFSLARSSIKAATDQFPSAIGPGVWTASATFRSLSAVLS